MLHRHALVTFAAVAVGCSNGGGTGPETMLPADEPMVLAFSDGSEYPSRATLEVAQDPETGLARFALLVTAVAPGDHEIPSVGAPIDPADARALLAAVTTGGASVPYGDGLLFSYRAGDVTAHRAPSTIRLWLEGATTHIDIEMGAAVAIAGEDVSSLAPSATATLVGQLSLSCVVPASPGSSFTMGDPTWTHAFCRSTAEEYGLGPLLDAR